MCIKIFSKHNSPEKFWFLLNFSYFIPVSVFFASFYHFFTNQFESVKFVHCENEIDSNFGIFSNKWNETYSSNKETIFNVMEAWEGVVVENFFCSQNSMKKFEYLNSINSINNPINSSTEYRLHPVAVLSLDWEIHRHNLPSIPQGKVIQKSLS